MDREKMIDGWGKELARVRSQMEELGPIAVADSRATTAPRAARAVTASSSSAMRSSRLAR